MGSVCIAETPLLDILLEQEVSNKTLSCIPLKVSAIADTDYVMKSLAMAEQKMDGEKLSLKDRPAMTVTATGQNSVGENILGYVDPGAAHTIIRKSVVEKSGIKIFHDARAQVMSGFGGKTERSHGFCFLANEITGTDAGGQERTVRFFTIPAVVEDAVIQFPYLLGGELTNRLRLRYEDEEVMSMWSHYGELRVQRLDGQTVLKRVKSRITATVVSEEAGGANAEKGVKAVEDVEDKREVIKKGEEKRPSREAIGRNDWSPQSFTLTWPEAKSQTTIKVSYESNVFKHIPLQGCGKLNFFFHVSFSRQFLLLCLMLGA